MVLALAGNLYPVPEGPYGKLPYIYLAYLAAVLLWFIVHSAWEGSAAKRGIDLLSGAGERRFSFCIRSWKMKPAVAAVRK